MSDVRIKYEIIPDDGTDGYFWRNGERWLRERGKEIRLLDLAPHLESKAMMEMMLADAGSLEMRACKSSLGPPEGVIK